jgi:hypothetical protein
VELLHPLEVGELVGGQEAVRDLYVLQILRRVCDEVQDCPERLLAKSVDDHNKHRLLIVDVAQPEVRVSTTANHKLQYSLARREGRRREPWFLVVVVH